MISADAIAILASEHCPEDLAAALDAELTEIETSAEYARLEREMAEKPARCRCLHTQRSHEMRKVRKWTRVTYKRLGPCLLTGCGCQQFVRTLADSLAAAFGRQPVGGARGGTRS